MTVAAPVPAGLRDEDRASSGDRHTSGGSARPPSLAGAARGGVVNLVGAAAYGLLGFALVVVVTRGLGLGQAGALLEAVAVCTIVARTTTLGTDAGLVRFVARARALGDTDAAAYLRVAVAPVAAASVVAAAVVLALAGPLGRAVGHDEADEVTLFLRALAPFVPVLAVTAALESATRGFGTMVPAVVLERVARPLLQVLAVLAVLAMGGGPLAIGFGWGLPSLVSAVGLAAWLAAHPEGGRRTSWAEARPLAGSFWRFSGPRALSGAFAVAVLWLDVVLVGAFGSAEEAAVYGATSRYVTLAAFAALAVTQAVSPQLSALLAAGDRPGASRLYQASTGWLVAMVWPVHLVLMLFGPVLLQLFGEGYDGGAAVLVILGLAGLVGTGVGPVDVVLLMAGRSGWNLATTALALVVNVVLNIVLVPRWGVEGAAVAWAASILCTNLIPLAQTWAVLGMHPFGRGTATAVPIALGTVGGTGLLARFVLGPTVPALAVTVVVGGALHLALLSRRRGALDLALRDRTPVPMRTG
jgi:O-antigen/teichoic acid export membrane protein